MAKLLETLRARSLAGAVLLVAMVIGGCSRPPGTVEGRVLHKGQPLTGGSIMFFTQPDNSPHLASIESDGAYKVYGVPAGPTKVAVVSEPAAASGPVGKTMYSEKMGGPPGGKVVGDPKLEERMGKGGGKAGSMRAGKTQAAPKGKYVEIPDSYKDPEKSGLTYTVKSGMQKKDFDLP